LFNENVQVLLKLVPKSQWIRTVELIRW